MPCRSVFCNETIVYIRSNVYQEGEQVWVPVVKELSI